MSQFFTVAGSSVAVSSVTGSNGVTASPSTGNVIVSGVNATTTTVGVASFNSVDFTVDGSGKVSLLGNASNYVLITGPATYTASATDYYIACDPTNGVVTILLPTAPIVGREFVVKDATGTSEIHNITVAAVLGIVLFDGLSFYTIEDSYDSVQVLFGGTNYQVY